MMVIVDLLIARYLKLALVSRPAFVELNQHHIQPVLAPRMALYLMVFEEI